MGSSSGQSMVPYGQDLVCILTRNNTFVVTCCLCVLCDLTFVDVCLRFLVTDGTSWKGQMGSEGDVGARVRRLGRKKIRVN